MSYTITIKQTRRAKKIEGGAWTVVEQKVEVVKIPGTEEWDEAAQEFKPGPARHESKVLNVNGYTPTIEVESVVDVEILKQTVDELDLPAVIRAVNKL